jgi:signal transduction histidine kinase/CheY-like chemotaxis protein/HPt (histidine-containing phosphotransfer) domain-containing protein
MPRDALETTRGHLLELRACVETLAATCPEARGGAERMVDLLDTMASELAGERRRLEAGSERINEVLEAIYAVAALDFTRRAEVRGDEPIDAIALSINMLSEEIEEAQRRLVEARASAEAATVAKSRFLAQMSHEIRTPLTALLGFTDLLAAAELSDSDRLNYAMIVRRNGEHLLSVINDILDLSKIEAQKLQVERIECSPAALLADLDSLMRARATERGLSFEIRLETPIPALFRTDPTRLRQVLLNVIGNAIKFTESGGVRVLVGFDAEAERLRFAVADTGIGLTPEQLSRLFQPFEQADLSMTRRFGGSGLGLAISRYLVTALGGEIEAASAPGIGSRFTVSVPATAEPGGMLSGLGEAQRAVVAVPAPAHALAGTLLLAEDGSDNQILITTMLRSFGLTVAVAENGAVAVDRALGSWRAGSPYDLLFMDMQMPVLDGYEATARLRAAGYPRPIVALTAHAMDGELERCLAAGCDAFVRKPIERPRLIEVLSRYLSPRPDAVSSDEPLVSAIGADPTMAAIVSKFTAGLRDRGAAIQEAARTGAPELRRLVHQLRGAAGGYGFPAITEAAARLEQSLIDGARPTEVGPQVEEIVQLCGRARAVRA